MPTYNVYGSVVGSKFLGTFDAENEEEAISMALDKNGFVNLCYQCTSECEDPEIHNCDAELVEE